MEKPIPYISAPYGDPDPKVREWRYRKVTEFASILVAGGLTVYSPITHTHPMTRPDGNHLLDHKGWLEFDRPFMDFCTCLVVLKLPGWEESTGIGKEETIIFDDQGKPMHLIDPFPQPSVVSGYFFIGLEYRLGRDGDIDSRQSSLLPYLAKGLSAKPVFPFGRTEMGLKVALKKED